MPDNQEKPVAIITGASSGIGEATARLLAKEGYRVVLAARRAERLKALKAEIEADGGEALDVPADVGDLDSIQHLVDATISHFGQIDLLFNNAGFGRIKWLDELDYERDIQRQLQVDALGVILTTRAALPHMLARRKGHIINMGSMASFVGTPTYTIYAASKHAVRGFSEALRREVGIYGIHVSVIYPGGVATGFSDKMGAERKTGITTPKLLLLSAEDVARAVLKVARRPRSNVVLPWLMWFTVWFDSLFPGLNDWIIERGFTRRERDL